MKKTEAEAESKIVQIPPLKWKPANIDPDIDKLMELSKNFVHSRHVVSKSPEAEFFKSLDLQRIKEWDEQADKVLSFYLQLKESIVFIRGVHIVFTYFDYLDDIWKKNKNRKEGEKRLETGYDIVLGRALHGITASWRRSKFVALPNDKTFRATKHLRIGERNGQYTKDTFYCASRSVRDYIYYRIECNLAVLRAQTDDLGTLARGLRQYNGHGEKLFQDHEAE